MKRLIGLVLIWVICATGAIAHAQLMFTEEKPFGPTAPAGTSYWVVNLTNRSTGGYFTASFPSSFTQGVAGTGTTLTFSYASANESPTALEVAGTSPFPFLDWQGTTTFAVDTGTSKYAQTLEPQNTSFLILRYITGVTNLTFRGKVVGR